MMVGSFLSLTVILGSKRLKGLSVLPMAIKLACKIYQLSISSSDAQPLILEELNVVVTLPMVNLTLQLQRVRNIYM